MNKYLWVFLYLWVVLVSYIHIENTYADAGNAIYGNISILPESRENKLFFRVNNSKLKYAYGFFDNQWNSNITISVDSDNFLTYKNKEKKISFKIVKLDQLTWMSHWYVDWNPNSTTHMIMYKNTKWESITMVINNDKIIFNWTKWIESYLVESREKISNSLYVNRVFIKDGKNKKPLIQVKITLLKSSEFNYNLTCSQDWIFRIKQWNSIVFESRWDTTLRVMNGYDDNELYVKAGEYIKKTTIKIWKQILKMWLYVDSNNPNEHTVSVTNCSAWSNTSSVTIISWNETHMYNMEAVK